MRPVSALWCNLTRSALLIACLFGGEATGALAADDANPYNDPPPARATDGIPSCAPPVQRKLSPEEARREAHQRVERGTSCWLAGTCEPGGDYKHDGEINQRVVAVLAADKRLSGTSLWVETLRGFVTVKGCLAAPDQDAQIQALVKGVPGVKLVWQEAGPPVH